jgi:hypothetical protein
MTSSAQLERKAEQARERLADRLADLRFHASPATVVSELFGINPRALGDDLLPLLTKEVRNNPVAALLVAAGVGWYLYSEVRDPLAKLGFGHAKGRQTKRGRSKKRGGGKGKSVAERQKN